MAQTNESQEQVTVNVETLQPVTRTLMTIGALPTSYLISMTYEEQLLWLQNYLIKTVIPAINNNAEATQEVQDIVMALQDYINDYFNNLDVEDELNKILDKMADDGFFDQYFENYFNKLNYYLIDNSMTFSQIQDCFNTAGAKVIEFTKGNYTITNAIRVNADTKIILNNSTLQFTNPNEARAFYNFYPDDEFLGYNGNGNIEIVDGTIDGGTISFCHAKNLLFKNLTFINCRTNHVFECAANNNVVWDNCYFEGIAKTTYNGATSTYQECIQIDDMTSSNFPWFSSSSNPTYDNTPNELLTIKNCKFISPNYTSTVKNNIELFTAIGSHTNYSQYNNNIIIENCIIKGWIYAGIRAKGWRNLKVNNCSFINHDTALDTSFHALRLENDCRDYKISNNNFSGCVTILGTQLSCLENFEFNNNILTDISFPIDNNNDEVITANNEMFMFLKYLSGKINIHDNIITNCKRYFIRCETKLTDIIPDIYINNNNFISSTSVGFLHLYSDGNYSITNNVIDIGTVLTASGVQNNIIRFGDTRKLVIKNNSYPENFTSKIDWNWSNTRIHESFKNVYDYPVQLINPNLTEFTNLSNSNEISVFDFSKLVINIGSQTENLTQIYLQNFNPINKLSALSRFYEIPISTSETGKPTGTLTINNDGTMSGILTNFRFKNIYGMN